MPGPSSIRPYLIGSLKYMYLHDISILKRKSSKKRKRVSIQPISDETPDSSVEAPDDKPDDINVMNSETFEKKMGDILYENDMDDLEETNDIGCKYFKKIQVLFNIISNLIKYKILQIDDEMYQKVEYEKLKYIKDEEHLIFLLGYYSKAFNRDIEEYLYSIIKLPYYTDFTKISNIDINMIPFVANDKIKISTLETDYDEFAYIIRDFACDILDLKTNFDPHDIICNVKY